MPFFKQEHIIQGLNTEIMKKLLVFIVTLSSSFLLMAQDNTQFTSLNDSDPASKALLDQLKKEYSNYQSLEADFTLNIEIPEEDLIVQKGTISQKGEKYRLEMEKQTIISNGETLWYHVVNNNEVQVNNVDPDEEDGEVLSPQNFMKFYDENKFICAPVITGRENSQSVRWIELKPVDKFSEYFKLRVSLANKSSKLLRVKA